MLRHTRGAPAGIQRQLQRLFIVAKTMAEGEGSPTLTAQGISPVWQMDAAKKSSVYTDVGIPLDIIASRDMWAYPVFTMSVNLFANIRFGVRYLPMARGISIAGTPTVIENTIAADGTGTVIPKRPEWLTLEGWRVAANQSQLQRDDFTNIANMQLEVYRDGASDLDPHPGNLYLQGLAIVYEAFV